MFETNAILKLSAFATAEDNGFTQVHSNHNPSPYPDSTAEDNRFA